jgi:hypothetical protein
VKRFLPFFLILASLHTLGNDTLTRAQVYNFNVGDTFDYRYYNSTESNYPGYTTSTSIDYIRFVVTDVYFSSDSSTKYIVRRQAFPMQTMPDTLVLTHPFAFEVILDTPVCQGSEDSIVFVSASIYNHRVGNTILMMEAACNNPYSPEVLIFIDGLGDVLYINQGMVGIRGGTYWTDSIELVYYSKGSETWGTPYYDQPSAINPLSTASGKITLFPTLNDGLFNVKITDASLLPIELTVYDMEGREVRQLSLNNLNNSLNIKPCSDGIYIWKALRQGELIETGKMVVE